MDSIDKDRSTCNNKDGSVGHIRRCYKSDEERKQKLADTHGEFCKTGSLQKDCFT